MAKQEQHLVLSLQSGDELSVKRFTVREEISGLFSIKLFATSGDPELDLDKIVGAPAAFQIHTGHVHVETMVRRWTGICEWAEQVQAEPRGDSTYFFHVVPALWLTTQRRETRIFQEKTLPEIIKAVLSEWGIEPLDELQRTYKKHEYVVQYGETDFHFLSRLMEWEGISFYFKLPVGEPKKKEETSAWAPASFKQEGALVDATKAVVAGTRKAAKAVSDWWNQPPPPPPDPQKPPESTLPIALAITDQIEKNPPRPAIPYVDNPGQAAEREFVTRLRFTHHVRPGRFTIRDFDFRKKVDFPLFGKEAKAEPEPESFYEQYHYKPGAFLVEGGGGYQHDQEEGNTLATRGLAALRTGQKAIRFATNCVDLAPGAVFKLAQHPREDVTGQSYLVTRMNLEGIVNEEWVFEGDAVFASEPYVPAMRTPKPRIRGVQSAIVTGPKGNEIYVDPFGRIKVQFHWDRDGKYDEKSSCWIRVNHEWAGVGFGTMMLPRVGQEVLVGFIEGDPDHPVVVGRVYNSTTRVPYKLPDHKTRSTWKSDSSPTSDGFNELMFEDLKDQELVFMQAELDQQKLVKQYETDRVGQNHMTVIGESRSAVVSKLDATMVGQRFMVRTISPPSKDDLKILPQQEPSISPRDTVIEMKDKRIIFTTGQASVVFDDDAVRFEASGSITVKAKGGDCIIEGSHVYLNSKGPAAAPKPEPFELTPPGIFAGHAADPRVELSSSMSRDQLTRPDVAPPPAPAMATDVICELVNTLVHCQHPDALRVPCPDPKHWQYNVLEIVAREKDTLTLKSQLRGGCGKHTKWWIGKPKGPPEEKIGESHSTEYEAWYVWPLLNRELGVNEVKGYLTGAGLAWGGLNASDFSKYLADTKAKNEADAAAKKAAAAGKPQKAAVDDFSWKGMWTGNATAQRSVITASACSGTIASYNIDNYPADEFKLTLKIKLRDWGEHFGWAGSLLSPIKWLFDKRAPKPGETPVDKPEASLGSGIELSASAKWEEWPKDHRAYYTYEVEASIGIEGSVGLKIPIGQWIINGFFPGSGLFLEVFGKWIDPGTLEFSISGSVKGSLSLKRKSPDTKAPTVSGKAEGSLEFAVTLSAHFVSKKFLSASCKGASTFKVTFTPDPSSTIASGPMALMKYGWVPLTVTWDVTTFGFKIWNGEIVFWKEKGDETHIHLLPEFCRRL